MLRRLDRRQAIRFTDIAAPEFSASNYGRDWATFMGSIQGRDAQGEWVEGVEVFRQLYAAVGFRTLVSISRIPGLRWGLERTYAFFAKHRLRLTGRPATCASDRCSVRA
jgi:predicted DCC family thiol-disulfide oxidoreductase YuxK